MRQETAGADAPARRVGQRSFLRQQDTAKGRATGWAQAGDTNTFTLAIKKGRSKQKKGARTIAERLSDWVGLRCGFGRTLPRGFILLGLALGTLRREILLHGLADFVHIYTMPLRRHDQRIRVAGWCPVHGFQQNDFDQQF